MRGVSDNKIQELHSKQSHLLDVFKTTTGSIGTETQNELQDTYQIARKFDRLFLRQFEHVSNWNDERYLAMTEALGDFDKDSGHVKTTDIVYLGAIGATWKEITLEKPRLDVLEWLMEKLRYQYYNGRTKTSRLLCRMYERIGGDTTSPDFQKLLAEWQGLFTTKPLDYKISWDITTFDLLGEMDVDDGSCYRKDGEWREAPIVLATGVFGKLATFVIRLYDQKTKDLVGRCWGFIRPQFPNTFYVSNAYYGDGINTTIALFIRVLEKASETALRYQEVSIDLPLYVNNGARVAYPMTDTKEEEDSSKKKSYSFGISASDDCICGNSPQDGRSFCRKCVGDDCVECNSCGYDIYDGEEFNCGECDQSLCGNCYGDTHGSCYQCGESICGDNNEYRARNRRRYFRLCRGCRDTFLDACTECGDEFVHTKVANWGGIVPTRATNDLMCEECEEAASEEEDNEELAS